MSEGKVVRFFVDSQNFLKCFWPENHKLQFELREVNWGLLTAAILQKVGAATYNSLNFYGAFSGGAIPDTPNAYRPSFAQLVGKELQNNPKFVVKPGSFKKVGSNKYTEKAIDTQIVVDMACGALREEYDVAVLFSGDLDMKPGIVEVLKSGRECVICGWNQRGLSYEIREMIKHADGLSYIDLTTLGTSFITRVATSKGGNELSSGEFAIYLLLANYHYRGIEWVSAQKIAESELEGVPEGLTNRYSFLRGLSANRLIESDFYQIGPCANVRLAA